MAADRRLQVFISSTFTDLVDERKAAVEAILEAGHIPAGMELFTAGDITQWDLIKRWISDSDVYFLLVGSRYGSIGPNGKSYTHMEFDLAKRLKKPMFSIVANDAFIAKCNRTYRIKAKDRRDAEKLRQLASKKTVTFFANRDQVKTQITQALAPLSHQAGIAGWVKAPVDGGSALLFPQSWRVGHGYLPDVERSHSAFAIAGMLWDQRSSVVKIGSPYLRYWLSTDTPKLEWLLENTKNVKFEIALFETTSTKTKRHEAQRRGVINLCKSIRKRFPTRLSFKASRKPSDISYIVYALDELRGATSRAMLGIQTPAYDQRPFVEVVFTTNFPPPLVKAAQALHAELF